VAPLIFYKKLLTLLGFSFAGFVLLFVSVTFVSFSPAPLVRNPIEAPSEEQLTLSKRETIISTGLKNPLTPAGTVLKGFPIVPLEVIAGVNPQKETLLTMTLIHEGKKLALIDGLIMKEGDTINQQKVIKIERDRVLLRNGKSSEKWVLLAPDKPKETKHEKTVASPQATPGTNTNKEDNG
jgi:hypothetical protein